MPLLDHFRPPLSVRRHWSAFHSAWAVNLAADLNQRLPKRYFAEANIRYRSEADEPVVVDQERWQPGPPAQSLPFAIVGDVVEVLVYETREGPVLAGAVELICPANKNRVEHRKALAAKCSTYLQEAVGVVLVDIVTEHKANLHNELMTRIDVSAEAFEVELYATAYRVVQNEPHASLQVWLEVLTLGQAIPTLPLWLRGGLCLPVELDQVYRRTCAQYRIEVNGH